MERCKLTQRRCRKEIIEIINANKCRSSLQNTHYLAKLFQLADADWEKFKQLPEIDQERFWLILHILPEYSRAMKSHFRKFGNQMSGSGNHLCNYAGLLA